MSRKSALAALACCVALGACQTTAETPAGSMSTSSASGGEASNAAQLVNCQQPLGTATVVEPDQNAMIALQAMNLTSPTPMLRIMLTESNCFRVIDPAAAANRRAPAAQYLVTPNVLANNPNAGGFNAGGFLGSVTGQSWMNNVAGSITVKEAQTAMFISDARTGEQIAAVQGKASATDFGVSFSGYGRGLNSAGAYSATPEGKVVMAAFVDAYNKLVAQVQARRPPPRVATAPRRKG
jgi:curli biogenesis system outer membrane secretion channel CsgG